MRSVEKAIVSDTVILRMIDRLGLRDLEEYLGEAPEKGTSFSDDAVLKKVRTRYQTKLLPNTRLVELEVRDFSPERSKLIAETLIEEFLVHLADERDLQESDLRATLVNQADSALAEALASEKQLEEFRTKNPDLIVEQDSSIFQDRLLQYSQSLNAASSESSNLEGTVAALAGIDPEEDPYRIFQILKNRNSEYLSELLVMHAGAKTELATVSQQYTTGHPNYREAESRLEQVEATIRNYATEMKSGLESEFQAATRREDKLRESLQGLQTDFVAFKSKSAEFRGLKEQIDRNWNTYTLLQEKITNLDLNPENEFNFVTLISRPIVPDKKSHPVTKLWVAAAGFLGLLLVGGALLFRYRDGLPFTHRLQIAEESTVGQVSSVHLADGTDASSLSNVPEILNLAIGAATARITHFTSASPESESDVFMEAVGCAMSRENQRTLLVSLTYDPSAIENEVIPTTSPLLARIELSARRLLDPPSFKRGLEQCLEQYDRILIDSSPLGHWETICATAVQAEANLVMMRTGQQSRLVSRRFLSQLSKHTSTPPSAVVLVGKINSKLLSQEEPSLAFESPEASLAPI